MAKTTRASGRKRNSERHTPRTDAWVERLKDYLRDAGSGSRRMELARFLSGGDDKVNSKRVLIFKVIDQNQRPSLEFALGAQEWMDQTVHV